MPKLLSNRRTVVSRRTTILTGLQRSGTALLLLTTLALTGCSVQPSGPPASGSSGTSGNPSASTGAGNGDANKTLRVVMTIEPTTLEPANLPDVLTEELVMHSFECLTRYNDKNEVEPCLAEKWDISSDGKTYTFHLRSGVKFHNGREFVADDVKYSWERALSPHTASPVVAGYPDGKGFPELPLSIIQQLPAVQAAAEIIRSNLKENLGINVTIHPLEAGEFYKEEQKHNLEFYYTGWVADYLDPQDFLSTLFHSKSSINRSGYSNPQFDALCAQADALTDQKKRALLYGEAHQILMDDMPAVPVLFVKRIPLVHTDVQGWRIMECFVLPNSQTTKTP